MTTKIAFNNYYETLKNISLDSDNGISLVDSSIKVINFDRFMVDFCNKGANGQVPSLSSCDALCIIDNHYLFIEFKNVSITKLSQRYKGELKEKLLNSLLVLNKQINKQIDFDKKNVWYYVVYSSKKSNEIKTQKGSIESRLKIQNYLFNRTNKQVYQLTGDLIDEHSSLHSYFGKYIVNCLDKFKVVDEIMFVNELKTYFKN